MAGLNVIAALMLLMLTVDCVVYGWFVSAWAFIGVPFAAFGCGALFFGRFKADGVVVSEGWSLGKGIDVTNPLKPEEVKVVLQEKVLGLGFLALGSPGSGKTESVAIGYLHYQTELGRGWAYHEGKGDKDIYQKCIAAGLDPDFFFSSELPNSDSMNLMEGDVFDVCDRLSKFLIGENAATSYYSDNQKKVLWVLMPLLKGLGKVVTLRDLYTVLTVEEAGIELVNLAKTSGNVSEADIEMADSWFAQKRAVRLADISGLLNRLYVFVAGEHTDRINAINPTINFERMVNNGKRIYLHLPLSDYARDLAIAITEMFAVIARQRQQRGGERSMYPLAFDDWGKFFYDGFAPVAARCRSAAMPLSFMFQSVGQLTEVAPTFTTTLDDTVATKVFLRISGQETAEFACKLFGEFESVEVGVSELGGRDGSNLHSVKALRLQPNELKSLNDGETYISTAVRDKGEARHRLYKARFPLLDMIDSENVDWPRPVIDKSKEGGLNLWDKYMNKDVLINVQQEIKNDILSAMEMEGPI